jgi:drug/metabolite transporter (DMT)-like permease
MSGISIASVLYQMIWVTTITYGIWFVLIGRYSATNLSVITFVTPVMGVLMGHLILDEALAGNLLLAVTAVAGGILLVSLPRRSR